MFISLVAWNNLLERLNPAEEPFNGTALLVEFQIEPDRSSPFWMFPGSPVNRNVGLESSFPVVLTNFSGIEAASAEMIEGRSCTSGISNASRVGS